MGGFANFYLKAKQSDVDDLGVILVDLPASLREAAMVKEVQNYSLNGSRFLTRRMDNGCFEIEILEEGAVAVRDYLKFPLEMTFDPSHTVFNKSCLDHIEIFEKLEGVRDTPIYAFEKYVDSAEYRAFYGLPPVSAIFPLQGNKLDSTRVGFAGIHTPWA